MNDKVRESEIVRDSDGRVVERVEVERPRKKGGFGWGMLFGVLIIAGGIIAFAYSQGSFQTAGVQADQATAQVEDQTARVAENTGDALETAGDRVESATDTNNSTPTTNSDTKTN